MLEQTIEALIEPSKYVGVAIAVQVALRASAEALTRISVATDNKWDNKIAGALSNAAWFTGVMLGYFGVGVPKMVIEEKILQDSKP